MTPPRVPSVLLLCLAACGATADTPVKDSGAPAARPLEDAEVAGEDASRVEDAASIPAEDLENSYARAAVVLGSCWPDDGVNRHAAYLWEADTIPQFWGTFPTRARCLANHGGGCAAVWACTGYTLSVGATSCTQGCRGDVFSECDGQQAISLDCGAHGFACSDGSACVQRGSVACDDTTFEPRCDADGRPEYCFRGHTLRGPDCAALGLACAGGACRGTGDACTDFFYPGDSLQYRGLACDGAALSACVGSKQHQRSCSDLGPGFACQETEGVFFCGLASECVPGELPDADQRGTGVSCSDGVLSFCNAGRLTHIPCASLGFDGCGDDGESCAPIVPRGDVPG